MRPTFRKLEVKDIGHLERLIAENVEGVEPGLKVVDSRLSLGPASIDLVGLDAKGSLVLIALDFSADDGLLLRVMDAYAWCLEYPDTLRRLYPMAQASSRPPRILFIVQKMTDAFLRRIKQLSFLEIDCFEFRNLEVNGASVVYFDLIERLRKAGVESAVDTPAPTVAALVAPAVAVRVEPRVERRIEPEVEPRVEPVKPAIEWPTRIASREAEPRRVETPRAVVIEPVSVEPAPIAVVEPDRVVVVEPAPVAVAEPAPVAVPELAPVATPEPEPVAAVAPVVVILSEPAPVMEQPSVVVEAAETIVEAQSVAPVAEEAPVPPAPEPAAAMPVERPLQLEAIEATSTRAHTNGHAKEQPVAVAPVIEAAPGVAALVEEVAAPTPAAPPAPVMPVEPAPAPVQPSPVWAKPGTQGNGTRPHFFAHATKSPTPVEAPAMVAAMAAPTEPATPPAASKVGLEVDDRPELESLSFPKDGLSRQWLEFLSQLGATK